MGIRKKYILMILFILLFNILGFVFYIQYVLTPNIKVQYAYTEQQLKNEVNKILENNRISDTAELYQVLLKVSNIDQLSFQLLDNSDHLVFEVNKPEKIYLKMTNSKIIPIDDNTYLLNSYYNLNLRTVFTKNFLLDLIIFESILLFITIAVSGTLIYNKFVIHLIKLNRQMDQYEKGIKINIQRSHRKDELGTVQNQFYSLIHSVLNEKQKQTKMIASISHDIKTPLTSIMGYVERLMKKQLPKEKEEKYLEIIYSKSQHINEMMNEFDEYTSYNLESPLELKSYGIDMVCDILQKEYYSELSDIDINFNITNTCSNVSVELDILKFKRVIGNLINNSIKNSKNVLILDIYVQNQDNFVEISFQDNGKGSNEDDLPFLFDPFFTSDKTRKVGGLGLSICKNIIEAHKGKISAHNLDSGGFCVNILLPLLM